MWRLDKKGFTLVEIMIVVAIIGLLAAIAIPNFIAARQTAALNACLANIRTLQAAVEMFRIANNDNIPVAPANLAPYLRAVPTNCPVDGTSIYDINQTSGLVTCTNVNH